MGIIDEKLGSSDPIDTESELPEEVPVTELDPEDEETSKSVLAGHAISIYGDVSFTSRGQEKKLYRTDSVWLGTCIKTGEDGYARIRMNDVRVDGFWVDQNIPGNTEHIQEVYREQGVLINPINSRVRGPTFILIGRNSEMCFETLAIEARQPTGLIELIKGRMRVILKGWTLNSSFNVRAGIAVCGIRGSDVFIQHIPDKDFVQALVIEGHMDVTSERTGETISLTDNQETEVVEGDILDTAYMSQERWDTFLKYHELRDTDFPDDEIVDGG
ncbi:MAG: hypothetical protein P1S60_16820 [Anaerolineae bacterium]|nr:hypothetical protein [Anaerolineae bacterium]